jgi:hypothetical protein
MSVPTVHFKSIRSDRYIVVRPLCERGNIICRRENSSSLYHEVTCKSCLKRLMAVSIRAAEENAVPVVVWERNR